MNASADSPQAEGLEHAADATRAQVDRTLDALADRVSLKRRAREAAEAFGSAASKAYRNVGPEITTLIRLDHTHVLAAFRRYRSHVSPARKRAIVAHVSLALEIHSQLEEEIFYRALFEAGGNTEELDKSIYEHDEMRSLIELLRSMPPRHAAYDQTFSKLLRVVLHHVAEEETLLIPLAQTKLRGRLRELGRKMTLRRFALLQPHAAEIASTTALTFPVGTAVAAAGVCAGVWLLLKALIRSDR
jgi:hypothetical protein